MSLYNFKMRSISSTLLHLGTQRMTSYFVYLWISPCRRNNVTKSFNLFLDTKTIILQLLDHFKDVNVNFKLKLFLD